MEVLEFHDKESQILRGHFVNSVCKFFQIWDNFTIRLWKYEICKTQNFFIALCNAKLLLCGQFCNSRRTPGTAHLNTFCQSYFVGMVVKIMKLCALYFVTTWIAVLEISSQITGVMESCMLWEKNLHSATVLQRILCQMFEGQGHRSKFTVKGWKVFISIETESQIGKPVTVQADCCWDKAV